MTKWQHRHSSCDIVLKDAQGLPMAGQKVQVELTNHEFLFGCGVFWLMDLLDPAVPAQYRPVLEKYWEAWSELFNYGTLPFYQGNYEPTEGKTMEEKTLRAAKYLKEQGCMVKGHPLCWHTVSAKWLLEKTNEAYALAKISGLKYCEFLNRQYGTDFISVMPTNLYGPNDNYHPTHSHVLPALIRRFHEAKEAGAPSVTCWGDGSPLREFLYVDDLANLCVFLMNHYSGNETVNAGTGKELTIRELTELVAKVVGYEGEILWDTSKPNGTPRKLLDVSKASALGWTYRTELEEGIRLSYQDFLTNPVRAER